MVAYQVLARKWRPKFFSHLKGQEHVTRALSHAITAGQLHHAYLFTGTRGVGKTTIARILAKCLNCQQAISAQPCGNCSTCLAIDQGRFVDLIEIDAASRTRVEDTRELLENVQYAPTQGRFKIYLIDEVHMLSGHSFNALLKTLEEPPAHVKFILATTDPERIPATVLSRCLRFSLKTLTVSEITEGLQEILTTENISYELNALSKVARCAGGSMRDALSLLEQAIAFGNGALKTHDAEEMLGLSYERFLPELLLALSTKDARACLQAVAKMAEKGADFSQLLAGLLQVFHGLALSYAVPALEEISAFGQFEPQLLVKLKDKFVPEEVQLLYQIGLLGQRDLPYAPDPRTGFEMVLLRMLVFRPHEMATSHHQPAVLAQKTVTSLPENTPPKTPLPATEKPLSQPELSSTRQKGASFTAAVMAKAPTTQPVPLMSSGERNTTKAVSPANLDWQQVVMQLPLSGLSQILVKHCILTKWEGEKIELLLDPTQKACLSPARQEQIQNALSQYMGQSLKLSIQVGKEALTQTPMAQMQQMKQEQQQTALETIKQDKVVQGIMTTFDATIEKIEIK